MSAQEIITQHLDIWTAAHKTRSTAGRGSNNKLDLVGIKKLRELILELAVRGKLVPQDPNDEPASELLKKIAAEKAKLIKEGKIKKEKPLPEITDEEKPFELPSGWSWSRLLDISAHIHYGFTASSDASITDVRLLRITDIQDDKVDWSSVPGCIIEAGSIKQYELINDDILIARTGGTIGKSYLVENIDVCAVFASYLIRVKHIENSYAAYKKVYLGSQLYWSQLYANSMGTGQPNVNGEALKNLVVSVPPLPEQHRIVAKVDELMAFCDQLEQTQSDNIAAHAQLVEALLATLTNSSDHNELQTNWQRIATHFDTLFTTEHSIDQLKQTILQLAVMGKLVPQDPNDEPASELLKKIAAEKAQLIKEGKIKKEKPLPEITEEEKPFELPSGWEYARLGNLTSRLGSGSTPRGGQSAYVESGVIFLRSQNVWNDGLKLNDTAFISEETHRKMDNTHVFPGDVLLNITGASLGRSTIFPEELVTANVSQHVTIIRLIESDMRRFFHLGILSPLVQKLVWGRQVGMAIEGLSKKVLEQFEYPVPPLAEQHRIVAKVDELMALCDALKTNLQRAQTTQLALADALVEQAVN
jgi:type I restriction enzyme, S subunit